jgi:phospho-N-acetylmuramoyl-pentapeptide-transferase
VLLRALLSLTASAALWLLFGSRAVAWLRQRFREPIVGDSEMLNALHQAKHSTPTMGGLFILAAVVLGVLATADLRSPHLPIVAILVFGLGVLGAADDLLKVTTRSHGLSARTKLAGQFVVATAVSWLLCRDAEGAAVWFVPLSALLIVASSNAVNLTDGLDGLAAGCLVSALSAFAILAYAAGDAIPGASEVMVIAAATIGGLLGFLRFNRHPARVFMGDTGSLPLGGLLAFVAIVLRQELLLAVIGGVFVMEAASVMLQVGVYKCRQYRVFRCAPLHHHFQFKGWPEPQIVARFWLVSALLAVVGLVCASIAT